MLPKTKLFYLTFSVIITVAVLSVIFLEKDKSYRPGISAEYDQALSRAYRTYIDKKKLGEDFTRGPCLTNDLLPGWVADTVHVPRQIEDELPENQCQALLEGRASHFVELSISGEFVRIK